jgi:glycosyltransferase involved in cell wall biosynthesis
VIVVDDGSTDDTLRRAHEVYGHLEHARFVQQPANLGKGAALRLGLSLAQGRDVITADADMAIDPLQFPDFLTELERCDVVPGSRAVRGRIDYDTPLRSIAGAAFNHLVRHYAKTNLRDTQCGCKGFRLGAARVLALVAMVDGFAFDVEALFLAGQLDLSVHPHEVTWQDVTGSSVRPVHDALGMLHDIRALARTRYENPVVALSASVSADDVSPLALQSRLRGLVLARGDEDALLVLGRNDALGGLGIATALKGALRTARLDELRGRRFEAI